MISIARSSLATLSLLFLLVTQAEAANSAQAVDDKQAATSISSLAPLPNASVLGASTVTNTGLTVVQGNVSVFPGTAITGFPPGIVVGGALHNGDAIASTAHTGAVAYYTDLQSKTCPAANNLTGQDLGGKTLTPGVYCFDSSAQLTGVLTLKGKKGSVFIFQIGSTLTTASSSKVVLTGGVVSSNVNWAIGSSATLGTNTTFQGIIDAIASITVTTGTSIKGRAWALNGAVTLDDNAINL